MATTARAGSLNAPIKPHRPSWADMSKFYPASSVTTAVLYNDMIKGSFTGKQNAAWLENTCATRMSYALIRSGFQLAQTKDPKASMLGGDKKWYWIRVNDLRTELRLRFKGFDAELRFPELNVTLLTDKVAVARIKLERKVKAQKFLDSELNKKNGIIVFKVKGWGDASGHFTLWNCKTKGLAFAKGHDDPSTDAYYPWLTVVDDLFGSVLVVQVTEIQFWELK